jgi:DNA-directed RNA polymerase subunit E'/Rpb7
LTSIFINSDEKDQLWVWEYIDDESVKHDMKMEVGERIRFKIREESFKDTSSVGPSKGDAQAEYDRLKKVPFALSGTCFEPGLGLISWWM